MSKIRPLKNNAKVGFLAQTVGGNQLGRIFFMQNEPGNTFFRRFSEKHQNRPKTLSKWTFEKSCNLDFFQCDREKPWFLIFSPENYFFKKDAQRHSEPFAPIFIGNGPFPTHFVTENRFCEFSNFPGQ